MGLTRRLLRTGDPAALFAMQTALLGMLLAPVDMVFQEAENRRTRYAVAPTKPLVFVCGAPRTGTTLVNQVLVNNLPVAYPNNLTSVFPRSPLTANRLFSPKVPAGGFPYHSYYGKTAGLSAPNDALYLWDRWFGTDRTRIRTSLAAEEQDDMRRFFGAMERLYDRPIVAKNNMLNACASLVAEVLPTSHFICMTREPLLLAQSQLQARLEINGGDDVPYGLANGRPSATADEDVCRQVLYHQRLASEQQELIGSERFWVVQYEDFCRDPSALVDAVATRILKQDPPVTERIAPFRVSNRVRIEQARFRQLAATLAQLGHPESETLAGALLT